MVTSDNYVIISEHDILILDYLSDIICILYGDSGAYGIVSKPYSVRDGINIFLSGLIPSENYRFRDDDLSF
jgi:ATP-binding cassette subfamily E protein 1